MLNAGKLAKLEAKYAKQSTNPKRLARRADKDAKKALKMQYGIGATGKGAVQARADAEAARVQQEADRAFMEDQYKQTREAIGATAPAPSPYRLRNKDFVGGVRRRKSSRRSPTSLASLRIAPTALNTGSSGSGGFNLG